MIKKMCVVTGGRADYGLLRLLMGEIQKNRQFQLKVIATGSHFLPKFGSTYCEILKDGFKIDARVDVRLAGDSPVALGKAMGLGVQEISRALVKLQPDLVILLGDRYEILAAAAAATLVGVPIAHLHGGELTEGAYDDAFRHAITKMSHLHFVSTPVYRKRVIQMGENPSRVFFVGALGVENALKNKFIRRSHLEKLLNFKFQKKNILVTFHPVTLEPGSAAKQTDDLLQALKNFPQIGIIFSMPGADKETSVIWKKIRSFTRTHPHTRAFRALGCQLYLSIMKQVNAVIGNSSSGIIEAPALKKPSVDIGNRQRGRIYAKSVIRCSHRTNLIRHAIKRAFSHEFQKNCKKMKNIHGTSGVSKRILQIISNKQFPLSIKKTFYQKKGE